MKKIINTPLVVSFFAIVLLASCKDYYNICDQNRTSTANGNFYSIVNGAETVNVPSTLVVSTLIGQSPSTNSSNPTSFSLYLIPNADSMSFTVKAANLPLDTIKLKYNTQLFTLSEDCGQISKFNISSIAHTKHTIDSIRVTNPFADQLLGNNFRIFY